MEKTGIATLSSRKIGIMGGTFNPIHHAHLLMAQNALEAFALEQVWFIPSGCSYMKEGQNVLSGATRLKLTELATASNPVFSVLDIEIQREGNTYTYETLEELCEKYRDCSFYFIVGEDSLLQMDKWRYPERIFKSAVILTAVRSFEKLTDMEQKRQELIKKYQADIRMLPMPLIDISSTDIRKRLEEGHSVQYLVPEAVREYILEHQLYHTEIG